MTLAESKPSACSAHHCSAHFVSRIPAEPGNIVRRICPSSQLVVERGFPTPKAAVTLDGFGLNMPTKKGVHNVHTLGFGFACSGIGLGRIGDVFGGVAGFRGLAPGSSPTSGTCFPCSGAF
jgi:hypothetical protein